MPLARSRPLSVKGMSVVPVCWPEIAHSVSPCRINHNSVFCAILLSVSIHVEALICKFFVTNFCWMIES